MTAQGNIANAILIIAGIYFLISNNFGFWAKTGIILLILFAFATWGMWTNPYKDQEKKLFDAKIKSEKAKALNYDAGSRQLLVQTKLLAQGIKI